MPGGQVRHFTAAGCGCDVPTFAIIQARVLFIRHVSIKGHGFMVYAWIPSLAGIRSWTKVKKRNKKPMLFLVFFQG